MRGFEPEVKVPSGLPLGADPSRQRSPPLPRYRSKVPERICFDGIIIRLVTGVLVGRCRGIVGRRV